MSNNSKASVLSFKIFLQIFSVYGCLFNCIYQIDNFFFCQANRVLCLREILCKPFVTSFTVVTHCFSETNDPLEVIFVPLFVHAMHIMLSENCWPINIKHLNPS